MVESMRKSWERLASLLEQQRLGVLATHHDNAAHASLVTFSSTDDLRCLHFVTPRATRKFHHLVRSPRVAFLVDSRENQVCDLHRAMAATAYGTARSLEEPARGPVLARYLEKHPHMKEFASSAGCALVEIRVERYSLVTRFQDVVDLEMAAWTSSSP